MMRMVPCRSLSMLRRIAKALHMEVEVRLVPESAK